MELFNPRVELSPVDWIEISVTDRLMGYIPSHG
jgi:hypothetical protein